MTVLRPRGENGRDAEELGGPEVGNRGAHGLSHVLLGQLPPRLGERTSRGGPRRLLAASAAAALMVAVLGGLSIFDPRHLAETTSR